MLTRGLALGEEAAWLRKDRNKTVFWRAGANLVARVSEGVSNTSVICKKQKKGAREFFQLANGMWGNVLEKEN